MTFIEKIIALQFVNAPNIDVACKHIFNQWKEKQSSYVVHFMYYASLELLRNEKEYARSMSYSDVVLVDGIGMQLYFKIAMSKTMTNLNGTDLSPNLIALLHQNKIPISFYGTTNEQINACNTQLNTQYQHQVLHYFQDGFSVLDWSNIPDNSALFVGMGTPLQENWVAKNYQIIQNKKLLVITVGGYFDFLSGFYLRAPKTIQRLKLEWLWRTILHPSRHYKKRWRDTTIIFRPFLDRKEKYTKYFNILDI